MDSIFIGRGLVPFFDISRPLLKCPPWSTILSEIDLNQAPQACMISGVGFTNPKCRYTYFFTSLSLLMGDRKSTRLNSSHGYISYAVFCLKKKKKKSTMYYIIYI